jgi:hypothetical protein
MRKNNLKHKVLTENFVSRLRSFCRILSMAVKITKTAIKSVWEWELLNRWHGIFKFADYSVIWIWVIQKYPPQKKINYKLG